MKKVSANETGQGRISRTSNVITGSVTIFLGIFFQSQVMAFNIYNDTDQPVKASVDTGNFNIEIPPHDYRGCNWQEKSCNASGDRTTLLKTRAVVEGSHFKCILPMQAGGYTRVQQRDRTADGLPPELYCASYTYDDQLTRTEPYGVASVAADVQFLVTGDPQFNDWTEPQYIARNMYSKDTLNRMIKEMNDSCGIAGCPIRGILVAGDLTQDSRMAEFNQYKNSIAGYDQNVFDGLGNHDEINWPMSSPGAIRAYIIQDRQRTATATNVRNPHYSWDWNNVHFVQLNFAPMNEQDAKEQVEPYKALQFLQEDLQNHVGASGRPVILIHHLGFDGFSQEWWSDKARADYWRAISPYNVAAVFTGHSHLHPETNRLTWNPMWLSPDSSGPKSIPTFVSGATMYGAFLKVNISGNSLTVQRMGPTDTNNPKSQPKVYDAVSYPIPTRGKAACASGIVNNLGDDYITAQFSVPESANNTVISFKNGTAHTYHFPRCYRVWWESMSYTCFNGTWMQSVTQRVGRDALCNIDENKDQPNLKIIYND